MMTRWHTLILLSAALTLMAFEWRWRGWRRRYRGDRLFLGVNMYTDEELYLHYRPHTASAEDADKLIAEHRTRFPLPEFQSDWTGVSDIDRNNAILEATKRAALLPEGTERSLLIEHALAGAQSVTYTRTKT